MKKLVIILATIVLFSGACKKEDESIPFEDGIWRMVESETVGGETYSYTYDTKGNYMGAHSSTYSYDARNNLINVHNFSMDDSYQYYTYDNNDWLLSGRDVYMFHNDTINDSEYTYIKREC